MNINETLSQSLTLLAYNGNNIVPPQDDRLNIFMGIGLWSVKDSLSLGLPIDVMQMLLSAAIMRFQIIEANRGKSSKITILIADSMAMREGAKKEEVSQLVQIYRKSLEPLLDLLNIKEFSEIILSSELENCSQYGEILESVENSPIAKKLKAEDEVHYAYIRTQTAISRYMNTHGCVGIKVGWICAKSCRQLKERISPQSLKHWDELKFDQWCEEIHADSTLQYLYAKAGLKQSKKGKHVSVSEGCPYTAYSQDQRYIIQTQGEKDIKTICPIQKSVANHWKDVTKVCSNLIQARLVKSTLLPENCIKKSNLIATVYNMLNHWANLPMLSSQVMNESSSTLSSWDSPILKDSYNLPSMAEVGYLPFRTQEINQPKIRKKYVLI